MSDLPVRIVKLEPLRVASFHGFGSSPEHLAAQKLAAWAGPRGYLADALQHRIFGFNNPSPSAGSPNYGYEFWIAVGPEVEATEEVSVQAFEGGLYAVTRCQGVENIGPAWGRLVQRLADSPYKQACHQWLEENLNPGFVATDEELLLDLYAPIAK